MNRNNGCRGRGRSRDRGGANRGRNRNPAAPDWDDLEMFHPSSDSDDDSFRFASDQRAGVDKGSELHAG